ncbi:MAG: hypothetical protein IJO45_05480 [Oscillospiraceae bacterium]|nr:hypothetical protein [Oscillospiraceae bacterium]
MTAVFLKLLNMSIAASWLVLAVIFLRLFLKKGPRWIACLLWGIVGLRLVMPFTIESAISLIPSAEVIPLNVAVSETPAIYSGIPAVNSTVNPLFTQYLPMGENIIEKVIFYAAIAWVTGMVAILLYSAVAYFRLWYQVRVSIRCRDNIYICDNVESPFLLGIFRPRIYVPSGMTEEHLDYVIAHENAHIKRRDHWWKPIGFLLLTVYWFNPLLWLAYILLCRDIERACDEKVIVGMDPDGKIGYSEALAVCSVHRRMIMVCPIAFGEISVKARIKGVLRYKKPAFWIVCACVLLCAVMAGCFLTNPKSCVHMYQGQITTEPTCTQTGIQTRVCSRCRHSYTVLVDMAEHSYDEGVVTKPSTCTHQGTMLHQCVGCGDQKTEPIEKTGHIAAGPTYVKEPNCTEEGEEYTICGHCSKLFVTKVLQTNNVHDLQETVLKAATCASAGEGAYICSRCGYSESCSYAQLPHNYVKQSGVEATCMSPGFDIMVCTGCGASYQVTIGQKAHNLVDYGSGYRICTYCGWRTRSGGSSLFETGTGSQGPQYPIVSIWP